MSKEIADLLRAGRAKIPTSVTWTKGAFERNSRDFETWTRSPDSCKWCGWGAVRAATPNDNYYEAWDALDRATPGAIGFPNFQDDPSTNHEDVLACFDRAIAAEESTP